MPRTGLYRVSMASLIMAMGFATLFIALGPVDAGVLETPTGGLGSIDRPAPQPRPDGFGTTIGGDPNV